MMPVWVPLDVVVIYHDRQISRHGGAAGIRDLALLANALMRPQNKAAYGEDDLHRLSAAYAYGIAKAHAFVDGNKRTAFVTAIAFLGANGLRFAAPQADIVRMMEDLARDAVGEGEFGE